MVMLLKVVENPSLFLDESFMMSIFAPLEKELGHVPYARTLHASRTAVGEYQDGRAMLYGQHSRVNMPAAA